MTLIAEDQCVSCKFIFILFAYVALAGSIIYLAVTSGDVARANTLTMVAAWFIAFGVGHFGFNILRIALIACFVKDLYEEENALSDEENASCFNCCCSFFFVPPIAKEIMEDFDCFNGKQEGGAGKDDEDEPQSIQEEEDLDSEKEKAKQKKRK